MCVETLQVMRDDCSFLPEACDQANFTHLMCNDSTGMYNLTLQKQTWSHPCFLWKNKPASWRIDWQEGIRFSTGNYISYVSWCMIERPYEEVRAEDLHFIKGSWVSGFETGFVLINRNYKQCRTIHPPEGSDVVSWLDSEAEINISCQEHTRNKPVIFEFGRKYFHIKIWWNLFRKE